MTKITHISDRNQFSDNKMLWNEFKESILQGLSQPYKKISSKYFYDKRGSQLFTQITYNPEYYLTQCELEILKKYKKNIANLVSHRAFNLVELGPGEGIKVDILLAYFLKNHLDFTYIPIDISIEYLKQIISRVKKYQSGFQLQPIHSDYLSGLNWLNIKTNACNIVLFLGSSIGNFSHEEAEYFLRQIFQRLHVGDYLIIGFDLRKDISTLLAAYNDTAGLTRAFNFNLLHRLNREFEANFNLQKFAHYPSYNVMLGTMESHLISLESQEITLNKLKRTFHFDKIEPIHVEYSYKYLQSHIESLAQKSGFTIITHLSDAKGYFVDSIWQKK